MYSFGVTLHFNKNVIPTFWSNFGITLLTSPLGGVLFVLVVDQIFKIIVLKFL